MTDRTPLEQRHEPQPYTPDDLAELRAERIIPWPDKSPNIDRLLATIDVLSTKLTAYEQLWECNGPRDCVGTERGCTTCGPSIERFTELMGRNDALNTLFDALSAAG